MNLSEINQLTVSAYQKLALKYHESFKDEMINKEFDRNILDKFSTLINKKGIICDAGCGPSGHIGKYLYNKGHEIIGIDISPECIHIANEYEQEIAFQEMDMMKMSFESNKFDGLISFYSIIHTPKKAVPKIINEFNRILKIGGNVLMVTKKGIQEGIVKDEWYEGNEIYFSHFMEDELIEYLSINGFEIELIETRTPYDTEIDTERIYIIAKKIKSCS